MKDIHALVADVEATWQTSTHEQRNDLITELRDAEGAVENLDDVTRTHIAGLIHTIQAAQHSSDRDDVAPPLSQGTGFGFGQTLPGRFDTPNR